MIMIYTFVIYVAGRFVSSLMKLEMKSYSEAVRNHARKEEAAVVTH
jgi:hypothetical protein